MHYFFIFHYYKYYFTSYFIGYFESVNTSSLRRKEKNCCIDISNSDYKTAKSKLVKDNNKIIPTGFGLSKTSTPILFVYNNTMLCENIFYDKNSDTRIMKMCFLTDIPFLTNIYNKSIIHANVIKSLLEESLWGFSNKEIDNFKTESCELLPQKNHIYDYKEIKRFCDVVINFVDSIIKSNSVKSIEWDGEIFHYYIVNNENNELIKLSLSNYKQNSILSCNKLILNKDLHFYPITAMNILSYSYPLNGVFDKQIYRLSNDTIFMYENEDILNIKETDEYTIFISLSHNLTCIKLSVDQTSGFCSFYYNFDSLLTIISTGFDVQIYDKTSHAIEKLKTQIDESNNNILNFLSNKYEQLEKNNNIPSVYTPDIPIYYFLNNNDNEIDIGSKNEDYLNDYSYNGLFLTNTYYVNITKSLNRTILYSRLFYNITTKTTESIDDDCAIEIVINNLNNQISGFIISESARLYDSDISLCHLSSYFYSCEDLKTICKFLYNNYCNSEYKSKVYATIKPTEIIINQSTVMILKRYNSSIINTELLNLKTIYFESVPSGSSFYLIKDEYMKLFINDVLFIDILKDKNRLLINIPLLELNKRNNYSFIQDYYYYFNGSDVNTLYERNTHNNLVRIYPFNLQSSYNSYNQFIKYIKSELDGYRDNFLKNNNFNGYFIPISQNIASSSRYYFILNDSIFTVIKIIKTKNNDDYDIFKLIYHINSFSQSIVVNSFDKEYSTYLLSSSTTQKVGCNIDYNEYNYNDKILCEKIEEYINSNVYKIPFTLHLTIENGMMNMKSDTIPFDLTHLKFSNIIDNNVLYKLKLKSNKLSSYTFGKYEVNEINEVYSGITPGYYYKITKNESYFDIIVENITQFINKEDSTFVVSATIISKCFIISIDNNNIYCVDKNGSDYYYWLESLILNEFIYFPKISYSLITSNISNIVEYYQIKTTNQFLQLNIFLSNQCSDSNSRLLYLVLENKEEKDDDEEKLVKNSQFIGRGDIAMNNIYRGFFITESRFIYIYKNYTSPGDITPEIKYVFHYSTIYHDDTKKIIELVTLDIKQSQVYDIRNDKVYSFEEYSSKISIDEYMYEQIEITFTYINETHFYMIDNLTDDNNEYYTSNIIIFRDSDESIINYSNIMFHLQYIPNDKSLIFSNNDIEIYKINDKYYSLLFQKNENIYKLRIEIDLKNDYNHFLSVSNKEYIYYQTDNFETMDLVRKYTYLNSKYVLNEINNTFLSLLNNTQNYIESIELVEKPSEYTSDPVDNKKLSTWLIVIIIISSIIFILIVIILMYGMYRHKKKVIIKIKRKRLSSYEEKKIQNVDDSVILLNQNRKKKINEKVHQPENDPFIPPPPQIEDDDKILPPLKPQNAWN